MPKWLKTKKQMDYGNSSFDRKDWYLYFDTFNKYGEVIKTEKIDINYDDNKRKISGSKEIRQAGTYLVLKGAVSRKVASRVQITNEYF